MKPKNRLQNPRASRRRLAFAPVLALVVVLGSVACGSSKSGSGATGLPSSSTSGTATASTDTLAAPTRLDGPAVTIKAIDNDFVPKNAVVKVGTAVTFDNTGHNTHDITPVKPGAFDFTVSSDDFGPGKTKTFTFSKPGTYTYYCSLHATPTAGSMRGQITVEP